PLPCRSGHDERQCHWIEINWTQNTFAADFLIKKDRKRKSDNRADNDVKRRKDCQIGDCPPPMGQGPEFGVIREPDKAIGWQHSAVGERENAGIDDETVDEHQHYEKARTQHQLWHQFLYSAVTLH